MKYFQSVLLVFMLPLVFSASEAFGKVCPEKYQSFSCASVKGKKRDHVCSRKKPTKKLLNKSCHVVEGKAGLQKAKKKIAMRKTEKNPAKAVKKAKQEVEETFEDSDLESIEEGLEDQLDE